MEKKAKSSKKWILAIVLIVIIIAAAAIYFNAFSVPTGLAAGTTETTTTGETFTLTGDEILGREITEILPYYESIDLEPGRYTLQVEVDKPVWIMLYTESGFEKWENGRYGHMKAGTGCCGTTTKTNNHQEKFDINSNEGGKYYIIIEGMEETSIKLKITQISKF